MIPTASQVRKSSPIFTGFMLYFSKAITMCAMHSNIANEKHNPGEPLHWSKGKSADHADCIIRHQIDYWEIDPENGLPMAVSVFWRAGAQLEIMLEGDDPRYPRNEDGLFPHELPENVAIRNAILYKENTNG